MARTISRTEHSIRTSSVDSPVFAELSDKMIHVLCCRAQQELAKITGIKVK